LANLTLPFKKLSQKLVCINTVLELKAATMAAQKEVKTIVNTTQNKLGKRPNSRISIFSWKI